MIKNNHSTLLNFARYPKYPEGIRLLDTVFYTPRRVEARTLEEYPKYPVFQNHKSVFFLFIYTHI